MFFPVVKNVLTQTHIQLTPRREFVISIGVRGGGSGRAADPPGLKIFRANSVFRASASCSKTLNDKKIFQYSEKFHDNSVFQGKRKLLKNPECKKYIQYSEKFQGNSVLQGKLESLKNPE